MNLQEQIATFSKVPAPPDFNKQPHEPPSTGEFSGIMEPDEMKQLFDDMKEEMEAGLVNDYASSKRRAAIIGLQGILTNNDIARDVWLIPDAIETLKELAEYEYGSEAPCTAMLGRLGFKEYDLADEANREKYFKKYFELWPQGLVPGSDPRKKERLPRGPENGVVPNWYRVMTDQEDIFPKGYKKAAGSPPKQAKYPEGALGAMGH